MFFDKINRLFEEADSKSGLVINIEERTIGGTNYREVLYTTEHSQLVIMSLKPGEEIGSEVHDNNDQFIRFEAGTGKVVLAGREINVSDGFAIVVPAGVEHNVINTGDDDMKLYAIYSPSEHPPGTVEATKE